MKTILIIGDDSDWESYLKFKKTRKFFKKIRFVTTNYKSVLQNKLPKIDSRKVLIMLFFPLDYWNNVIETNFVKGRVYGDKKCAVMFYDYLDKVENILDKKYKNISYVNSFKAVKVDRDKELTKRIIRKIGVPVPKSYATRNYDDILKLLGRGKKLYVKVNFGAMGKGITLLSKSSWLTNFIYRNRTIISRKGDYGWKFNQITGNREFLTKLLTKDLVIEEAVDPYVISNKKFDIRYYVVYGKIMHIIIRSTKISNVVTNITQGGTKERSEFLQSMPKKYLADAKRNAIKASKTLGLNFAGIDIMISKRGKPYVIEAQSFPGFPESKYNLSEKLAKEIMKKWK
ncbi:MAG: YheC/YheD family protein [Nanoarchaeota archaeon]